MKNTKLQLLVHAGNIKTGRRVLLAPYMGVKLTSVQTYQNPNYLIINLEIGKTAKPGKLMLSFMSTDRQIAQFTYELKPRSNQDGKTRIKGITSEDLIYLIMPDRFSNGDPGNDRIAGLKDQSLDRDDYFKRHGGDLKGIQNHLDYLQQSGITALWLNPVLLNDMPDRTEHGSPGGEVVGDPGQAQCGAALPHLRGEVDHRVQWLGEPPGLPGQGGHNFRHARHPVITR
jgi:hypothetical protein